MLQAILSSTQGQVGGVRLDDRALVGQTGTLDLEVSQVLDLVLGESTGTLGGRENEERRRRKVPGQRSMIARVITCHHPLRIPEQVQLPLRKLQPPAMRLSEHLFQIPCCS